MIGIVGGGQMGAGIAEVCARHGYEVAVVEQPEAVAAAVRRIESSLERGIARGKLSAETGAAAQARITVGTDWTRLAEATFILEAVTESLDAKRRVFLQLAELTRHAGTILATNTSSIPIARIAAGTQAQDRIIGLHFFQPVPVMPLVEIVPSALTSPETLTATEDFARVGLGRTVVRTTDRAGFIVNTLLMPYLLSAMRMFEAGFATAADIDTAMTVGCAHPMGPLTLADFIGLDTCAAIADAMFDEYREPLYAPPPILRRMVESGLLGRKSGQGFYNYATV